MKKPIQTRLAKFGTAAAILSVTGIALATPPTLTASYTGTDPIEIAFQGCDVGWGDTIKTYLSTDSTCNSSDLLIDT